MSTLDADTIRHSIATGLQQRLDRIEVFSEIGSTNSYLLEQTAPQTGHFRVALADYQTAGRGRMQKRWLSPRATGLCMSMAYTFARLPQNLPALTLAVGTAVVTALEHFQLNGLMLKWPNDVMANDRKLGGILTELRTGEEIGAGKGAANGATIVVGFGMNVDFRAAPHGDSDTDQLSEFTDLRSLGVSIPDRSVLAVALIECLIHCMSTYENEGFDAYRSRWQRYDWLKGQRVQIEVPDGVIDGTATGIDTDGALFLSNDTGTRRVTSGSIVSSIHVASSP